MEQITIQVTKIDNLDNIYNPQHYNKPGIYLVTDIVNIEWVISFDGSTVYANGMDHSAVATTTTPPAAPSGLSESLFLKALAVTAQPDLVKGLTDE